MSEREKTLILALAGRKTSLSCTSCAEMRKHKPRSSTADARVRAPRGRGGDAMQLSRRSLVSVRVKSLQ
eukprot:2034606-Rhodomonas_salina.1